LKFYFLKCVIVRFFVLLYHVLYIMFETTILINKVCISCLQIVVIMDIIITNNFIVIIIIKHFSDE